MTQCLYAAYGANKVSCRFFVVFIEILPIIWGSELSYIETQLAFTSFLPFHVEKLAFTLKQTRLDMEDNFRIKVLSTS